MFTDNQKQKHQQQETDNQKQKHLQREAVETFHGNFVEPLQKIVVQPQPALNSTHLPQQVSPSLFLAVFIWFLCLAIHIRDLHQHNSRP